MKRELSKLIWLTTFLLVSVVFVAVAQACEVDADEVIEIVDSTCGGIGSNEVCYGNFDVGVVAQDTAPDFTFDSPGDLTSLGFVRSLVLSAFDSEADVWGIAQMRLLASTNAGTQDVTLLLFGNVEVESAVESTETIDIAVGNIAANIRSLPSSNGTVLLSAEPGLVLEAVGRLADSSWIRVRVPDSENIGWVFADIVAPANADESFDMLTVQDRDTPYFGAMQAFYYTSGTSPECGNVAADGLIIQTPSGNARVNLLINEVSIELIGGQNGATAFVTANADEGMTVNMVDGTGVVTAEGTSYFVDATNATNIPMTGEGVNLVATGAPTLPTTYDVDVLATVALLPAVRDPDSPALGEIPTASGTEGTGGTGVIGSDGSGNNNSNRNGNSNSNRNGNANGNRNGRGR